MAVKINLMNRTNLLYKSDQLTVQISHHFKSSNQNPQIQLKLIVSIQSLSPEIDLQSEHRDLRGILEKYSNVIRKFT